MKSILGIIEELISKLTELDEIMFEKFFPDEYLGSTYKIPFEKLYEQGYPETGRRKYCGFSLEYIRQMPY